MNLKTLASNFIILLTVSITLWSTYTGDMLWPFFSYPMYALPRDDIKLRLMAEDDSGHLYPISNNYILWPIGPNGISGKVNSLIQSQTPIADLDHIFAYFYSRYQRIYNTRNIRKIVKMHIVRKHKDKIESIYTYSPE